VHQIILQWDMWVLHKIGDHDWRHLGEIFKRIFFKIWTFVKKKLYICFSVSFRHVQTILLNELLCTSNLYGGHLGWAEIFFGPLHFWDLHDLMMISWKIHACITFCTILTVETLFPVPLLTGLPSSTIYLRVK
jgi:hypothetical protein